MLLEGPNRMILLNTATGETSRLLQCDTKEDEATVDAKHGTGLTEACNWKGAYKLIGSSYFFAFQKALTDCLKGSCRTSFSPMESDLYGCVQRYKMFS